MEAIAETCTGRVRGQARRSGLVFRGVPFAAPPQGARRFLAPQPHEPWTGVRDATRSGMAAPQFAMPAFSWISAAAGAQGEDCLNLNIWTPALDGARRPVLVWIHGGGFLVGSGATPIYDGAQLAQRGEAVVVTINYRLGALGFAHLGLVYPDDLPETTNLGIRDQIAALEWVRENIERFGGDPGNVTVVGQSAGGMSVGALLAAPRARGLFHRAICMSGAGDHVINPNEGYLVAEALLDALGGPAPAPAVLGRLPLPRLLQVQRELYRRLGDLRTLMIFLPVVDLDVIPEPPLVALRRGAAAQIPILTGATLEEWKLFGIFDGGMAPFGEEELISRFAEVLPDLPNSPPPSAAARFFRHALGERSAAQRERWTWHAFQTARVFHWPSARLAEAQCSGGGAAHSYLFTWRAPAARRALGACHAIDIPFLFGSTGHPLARPLTGLNADARKLSRNLQDSWLQFCRSGEPGHSELPEWPAYDPLRRQTMALGRQCELVEAPLEEERALLERWARP